MRQESSKGLIIFGVSSYNEADNIKHITKIIDKGLSKYFKNYTSIILNIDNDSPDGVKKVFLNIFIFSSF